MLALSDPDLIPELRVYTPDDLGRWLFADRAELMLTINLITTPLAGIDLSRGRVLWSNGLAENGDLGPWGVTIDLHIRFRSPDRDFLK